MFQNMGVAVLLFALSLPAGAAGRPDAATIERLTGAKGSWNEKEGVFKVSVPRSDLAVSSGGVRITPGLGVTSWAAFTGSGSGSMVMGDTVLPEAQVSPVMSVALDSGLEVTALHNHLLGEAPRVMFLHVAGMGNESDLAAAIGKVFAKIRDSRRERLSSSTAIDPARTSSTPRRSKASWA